MTIGRAHRSLASRAARSNGLPLSALSPLSPLSALSALSAAQRLALLAILTGLALVAHGAWIPVKARLAQHLIERSWSQQQDRPWPWADTAPIARLYFERQDSSRIVLAGDSGAVLAFGPGHSSRSALPGAGGNAVISGHRDTQFALLRDLRVGDRITVETSNGLASTPGRRSSAGLASPEDSSASESVTREGVTREGVTREGVTRSAHRTTAYTVIDHRVIRADDPAAVATVIEDAGDERLTLVTCWPFDAIDPGTPWRYVVTAVQRR